MIKLKNIFKWVNSGGNKTFLLKDINLDIKEGEFVSIMGPSGSGKSTLLNVIGMLDEFNQGEYLFMDQPVHELKEKQKAQFYKTHIGFVFQASVPGTIVGRSAAIGGRCQGAGSKTETDSCRRTNW